MASPSHVRQYLAYWFQLGKPVLLDNGRESLLPEPVIMGSSYSDAFEDCWHRILTGNAAHCYLSGTQWTIAELLSPRWEISPCARCSMPVPMLSLGIPSLECPCSDLPLWPNHELPFPREPVETAGELSRIRDRLLQSMTDETAVSAADDGSR